MAKRTFQKRLGNEEIKRRLAQKVGHWKIISPDIDDIDRMASKIEVQCLDCGQVQWRDLVGFAYGDNAKTGCQNCKELDKHKRVLKHIEQIMDKDGYELESSWPYEHSEISCVVRHKACGHAFEIKCARLWAYSDKHVCKVCQDGQRDESLWDLCEEMIEHGITAKDVAERSHWSTGAVARVLHGKGGYRPYTEATVKEAALKLIEEKKGKEANNAD